MTSLRVGLIGCGHIASTHVRAWRRSGRADVTAAYDLNEEAARAFARRFGIERTCRTVDELLAAVDVADDCSPPAAHLHNALASFRAGRDYVVEKPIVLSTEELGQILDARQIAGRRLCVVHNLKFNRGVEAARRWVRAGRIGTVVSLERYFLTHPDADRMLRMPNHWSMRLPGGRWLETLPHELYLTHEFLGPLELADVVTVRAGILPPGATADEVRITLHNDSAVATFHYSARCRANHRLLVLNGTDGTIRVDILAGAAVLLPPRDGRWARGIGAETLDALATVVRAFPDRIGALWDRTTGHTPHAALIAAFVRSWQDGSPSPVSVEEIEYVVRMSDEVSRQIMAAEGARA
jgi:predicted dehydrogenase